MTIMPIIVGTCAPEDQRLIGRLWRRLDAGQLASVVRLSGNSHRVLDCGDDAGRHWIVRLTDADRARFDMEAAVIGRCAEAGIPVPVIDFVGVDGEGDRPTAAMIQRRADGQTLRQLARESGRDAARLTAAAGEVLAHIHQIPTVGYGPVNAELAAPAPGLGHWFTGKLADHAARAAAIDLGSTALIDEAMGVIGEHDDFLNQQASHLLHGDYSPDNLIVHAGRITAVIDWESAKAGPAGMDIGWWDCFFYTPATSTDDLIAGYNKVLPLDLKVLANMRRLTVLRAMITHFAWAVSVGKPDGAGYARQRLAAGLKPRHPRAR